MRLAAERLLKEDKVHEILVFKRLRLVLLAAGAVFAVLPVGSALAATNVGQTGTPLANSAFGNGSELIETSATMPASGTVTSFQTQSSSCSYASGSYDFQVLHPLGSNQYKVLGDTGNQTDPCDGQLHSYPVNITVQAGDVLGAYVVSAWEGVLGDNSGSIKAAAIPEPAVGDTITVPFGGPGTIDESATLVTLPTSKDQCNNGGWKTFGTTFRNQGDCVSFVATHGKNPPSGS